MGSLIREEEPLSMAARLIPAWTCLSIGNDDWSLGSGRPSEICIFLTAERKVLPVWGAKFASARKATNEHKVCSDVGKGCRILCKMHESV